MKPIILHNPKDNPHYHIENHHVMSDAFMIETVERDYDDVREDANQVFKAVEMAMIKWLIAVSQGLDKNSTEYKEYKESYTGIMRDARIEYNGVLELARENADHDSSDSFGPFV